MLHHYITQYREGGKRFAEAWLQIDLFGRCFCFSRRRIEIRATGAKDTFDEKEVNQVPRRKKQLRRAAGGRNGEEIRIKVDEQSVAKAVRSAIRDNPEASRSSSADSAQSQP